MIIRLCINTEEEELYSYETKNINEKIFNPEVISGLFEAIKYSSILTDENIRKIQFYNMIFYSKTYENFCISLLVSESIIEEELEILLHELSEETKFFLSGTPEEKSILDKETLQIQLEKILAPLIKDPFAQISDVLQGFIKQEIIPKIALVGLSEAGKSSIKFRFFEKWSESLAKQTKPTIGVDYSQQFQEFLLHKFVVMDLGGQSRYRYQYIKQEELWLEVSALLFVIDIQDIESLVPARDYLEKIWEITSKVNKEVPKLSLFFHKYDPEKRNDLNENISKSLEVFNDFIKHSTIYFTSVEDISSNVALIKALYISLPYVVLLRLFEKDFIEHFEHKILPQFSLIAERLAESGYTIIFRDLKSEIRKSAVMLGVAYESIFQELWLSHLMGEKHTPIRVTSSNSIVLNRRGNSLFVSIKDWTDQDYPKELTTLLLDGILEGILKTLNLEAPTITERNGYTTWQINF